jgi:hypothetical protein
MPAVSGLEEEFPDQVTAQNLNAFDDGAKPVIESLGFDNHGLVIRSMDGEVLWKKADHTVKIEEVRAAIQEILAS